MSPKQAFNSQTNFSQMVIISQVVSTILEPKQRDTSSENATFTGLTGILYSGYLTFLKCTSHTSTSSVLLENLRGSGVQS